jgi:hypothetical protein
MFRAASGIICHMILQEMWARTKSKLNGVIPKTFTVII